MVRQDLLTTEEGVKFMVNNWRHYHEWADGALKKLQKLNDELDLYLNDHIPLSSNKVARQGGFKRVNNTMGIYTNDLHRHLKALDSGEAPAYPPEYIPMLKIIDKEAQDWRTKYNEAVNVYKMARELYFFSLHKKDGTFDIAKWL